MMPLHLHFRSCSHPCVDKENGQTPKEDKSVYRRCWEVYHATGGFISIALGLMQVCTASYLLSFILQSLSSHFPSLHHLLFPPYFFFFINLFHQISVTSSLFLPPLHSPSSFFLLQLPPPPSFIFLLLLLLLLPFSFTFPFISLLLPSPFSFSFPFSSLHPPFPPSNSFPLPSSASPFPPPSPAQVTLGVFLVVPPLPVWIVWCILGGLWIITFIIHEIVYIILKIRNRVRKDY